MTPKAQRIAIAVACKWTEVEDRLAPLGGPVVLSGKSPRYKYVQAIPGLPLRSKRCDLNAALAVPWSAKTCIIAQACKRTFDGEIIFCGFSGPVFKDGRTVYLPLNAQKLAVNFDGAYREEKSDLIAEIRRMLPIDIQAEISGPQESEPSRAIASWGLNLE